MKRIAVSKRTMNEPEYTRTGRRAPIATVLLVGTFFVGASLHGGQADQVAKAEKEAAQQKGKDPKKKVTDDALASLMGIKQYDPATVERGRKLFGPTCGFCHGNDARGKSGPDLVRSTLVLHDKDGEAIGQILRNGRPERGMPAFASLSNDQILDISTFLHSRSSDVSNRMAYKIGDVVTGDAHKGQSFFDGAGQCATCHSATGDLAHVASKYEAVELQRRLLYPAPNMIDMFLGKVTKPPAPTKVTAHLKDGKTVTGTMDHMDEFMLSMHDEAGWYRSFSREDVTVDVQDPRAAHEAMLAKYRDEDMHNVLAYLETMK